MKQRWFFIAAALLLVNLSVAETVTVARRTVAYSTKPGHAIAGYFPAGSELEVLSREGRFVRVRFISPSGRNVEAFSLPQDLGLPLLVEAAQKPSSPGAWNPVDIEAVDRRALSPKGNRVLDYEEHEWDHAQTKHFSIHYEHSMFARKVSRLAEFYYEYISQDLKGLKDRSADRSHIFIFRKREDWTSFLQREMNPGMQWASAFVAGPEMYIQDFKDNKAAVNILAHEMTHLVLNRFFVRQLPLWLNEGLAEWYGAFAYSEFKGTYQTLGSVFRNVRDVLPLEFLLKSESYPDQDALISVFYQSCLYLVGFLRTEFPEEKFAAFLDAALDEKPMLGILENVYQITDFEEFEEDFRDFCGAK